MNKFWCTPLADRLERNHIYGLFLSWTDHFAALFFLKIPCEKPNLFKAEVSVTDKKSRNQIIKSVTNPVSELVVGIEDLGEQTKTQCHTVDSGNRSMVSRELRL